MRQYTVQPGDTPARIAAHFAGCPKCAADLVAANPRKPAVRYPNGFVTFRELRSGESLNLPDKWFSGALDRLPSGYFEALPSIDGHLGQEDPRARHHPHHATATSSATWGEAIVAPRRRGHGRLSGPPIPHCHAFTITFSPSQKTAATWEAALQSALAANGFTNVLVGPPDQNGNFVVGGIWEGAQPLDTSQLLDDGQGNHFTFKVVTDGGPANPPTGPCAVHITPKIIQNLGPPAPKQYNQPQGKVPQGGQKQGGAQQPPPGMSTGAKVGIGVAVAAAAGGALYLASKRRRRRR